jgi:hypothetical protein
VHAIHHVPTGIKHDRVAKIDFLNELTVLHDAPNGRRIVVVEPVGGVDLRNLRQRDVLDGQAFHSRSQAVDIPCVKPAGARTEVILLPHVASVALRSAGAQERHLTLTVRRLQCGWRSMGHIGGESPTWMTPMSSNPLRMYSERFDGLVASR